MRSTAPELRERPAEAIDTVRPAAFLDTALPLDFSKLAEQDSGRYHSIWFPDHMVSFWPESIWTPEFTDLATVSPSPHRQLDGLAVAAATTGLTRNAHLASFVVDTVRRHPAMLAQTALTISHLSKGRFILGMGSGELENTVPYGFDFSRPVARFEEAITVIKRLWESDGPVDFEGDFFRLEHARLDTEYYDGKPPPIWIGANGPRMLSLTGRHADGWWPFGIYQPEIYAEKLQTIRDAAEAANRDPLAITPALSQICLIGDEEEVAEMLEAPLVKVLVLTLSAENTRMYGHEHPMGPDWRGLMDFDPVKLSADNIMRFCRATDPQIVRDIIPVGSVQYVAKRIKAMTDAGARVFTVLDYGALAGLKYAAASPAKIRQVEDEVLRLVGGG